jgi:hypothetical protein
MTQQLLSLLMPGPAALIFDNVPNGATVHHPSLDIVLAEEEFSERVLGVSCMASPSTRTLVLVNGNNLSTASDTATRFVPIKLVAPKARKSSAKARGAKRSDPARWTLDNLPTILAHAFTVLAWGAHGVPDQDEDPRYEVWAKHVRCPLMALGAGDCVERLYEAVESDPYAEEDAELLSEIFGVFANAPFTTGDLRDQIGQCPLLEMLARAKQGGGSYVGAPAIGKVLAKHIDVERGGLTLTRRRTKHSQVFTLVGLPHDGHTDTALALIKADLF